MKRRRTRFPDKYQVGKSNTVPYVPNESWNDRHYRRKQAALDRQKEIEEWCKLSRWRLLVTNEGHHWAFYTKQNKMVEWFPSSGKFVIGKQWKEGIHIHDVDQLREVLEVCKQEEK